MTANIATARAYQTAVDAEIFSGTTTGLEAAVGAGGDTGVTITDEPVISVGVVTGYEVQLNRNEQGVWSCKHTLYQNKVAKGKYGKLGKIGTCIES